MKKETIWCKIFSFSIPTYYNWKKEKRPIVNLLEKYFSNKDLSDFLEKGFIEDLELFMQFKESANSKDFILFKQFLDFQKFQILTNNNLTSNQDDVISINKELEKENMELKNKLKKLQKIMQ